MNSEEQEPAIHGLRHPKLHRNRPAAERSSAEVIAERSSAEVILEDLRKIPTKPPDPNEPKPTKKPGSLDNLD
jgi:hypothetical protein